MTEEPTLDANPQRVLAIVAHPDDAEFGAGGSIARWIHAGAEAIFVILTDGSTGTHDRAITPESVAATRREEQLAGAAVLGVKEVRFLNEKDNQLEPTLALRREIVGLLREFAPDRVICHDPTTFFIGGVRINHPDHRAAGRVVLDAIFPAAESPYSFPELLGNGHEPHRPFDVYMTATDRPNTVVDITEFAERKIEAIMCHRSQVKEDTPDALRKRMAKAGALCGYPYGELFRVTNVNHGDYEPELFIA